MTALTIDKKRLAALLEGQCQLPAADRLFRQGDVFFVGGALPLYETLETMFYSFCTEATSLFYLTFGPQVELEQNLEMARQIKKNFHVRLMARLEAPVTAATLERIYAAGVDNLVLHLPVSSAVPVPAILPGVFPRWGVAATLIPGEEAAADTIRNIDRLLHSGILPLVQVSPQAAILSGEQIEALLMSLAAAWERNSAPLQAYLPLISAMTPFVQSSPAGMIRAFVDRLRDRQQLAGSELRRHLRVIPEDSLDSAGL